MSPQHYNFQDKAGLFRLKILLLVFSLLPVSACESAKHLVNCKGILQVASYKLSLTDSGSAPTTEVAQVTPAAKGAGVSPAKLEGSENQHAASACELEHGKSVARWSLLVALIFTAVMTGLQYWIFAGREQRGFTSLKNSLLAGFATASLLGASVLLWAQGNESLVLKPISTPLVSLIFPSRKNLLVAGVAFIFWYVDKNEPEFSKEAPTDQAVFFSVMLASVFVGVAQSALGTTFINAFNAGLVAFHLILGTILFEGRFR